MIKQFIRNLPVVGPRLLGLRLRYHAWQTDPARLIARALRGRPDAVVVQIGSNDGRTGDPIHTLLLAHPGWRALLVEPLPFVFARLVETYRPRANVRFENVAIAESAGARSFYHIREDARAALPTLPEWHDQLGSFDRGHIVEHLGAGIGPFIAETRVECLPLADLLARNGIDRIDLLHIDAEGYDWKILRQLDLGRHRPLAILFEHRHLTTAEKAEARARLAPLYRILDHGADYVCLLRRRPGP